MPTSAENLQASFWPGVLGRLGRPVLQTLATIGQVAVLLAEAARFSVSIPVKRLGMFRGLLFPAMSNVGARSFPIVSLVSLLIGAVLVLQTGSVLQDFGQIREVPGLVALSMTRELGPLMTAIVLIGRVGASYTAVLGSMNINEEIKALRTMAIHPIQYLIVPRFLSMLLMLPCLVIISYLVGMIGGGVVAWGVYGIPPNVYADRTLYYLSLTDVLGGLIKAGAFAVIISLVSCHFGLTTTGGSTGLGRNIMVSVVTCIVVVVVADAILTAFVINYLQ